MATMDPAPPLIAGPCPPRASRATRIQRSDPRRALASEPASDVGLGRGPALGERGYVRHDLVDARVQRHGVAWERMIGKERVNRERCQPRLAAKCLPCRREDGVAFGRGARARDARVTHRRRRGPRGHRMRCVAPRGPAQPPARYPEERVLEPPLPGAPSSGSVRRRHSCASARVSNTAAWSIADGSQPCGTRWARRSPSAWNVAIARRRSRAAASGSATCARALGSPSVVGSLANAAL